MQLLCIGRSQGQQEGPAPAEGDQVATGVLVVCVNLCGFRVSPWVVHGRGVQRGKYAGVMQVHNWRA